MSTIETTIYGERTEQKLSVVEHLSTKNCISIQTLKKGQENLLIEFQHEENYSYLDFSGVPEYKLIYLIKDNEIFGGTYAVNNSEGKVIRTSFKKILLIPLQNLIDENEKQERLLEKGRIFLEELEAMVPDQSDVGKVVVTIPHRRTRLN